MNYKIISTEKDLFSYKEAWHNLYKKTDLLPFASFEWNTEWYSKAYRTNFLYIIIVYESSIKAPLAICPMMIDKTGCLRFIADTHSDYGDFLVDPSMKSYKYYEVMKKIVESIQNEPTIKSIELKNIAQKNRNIGLFSSLLDYKKIVYQSNAVSYKNMDPKQNLFDNFDYLSSKQRSELKRVYKKHSNLKCVIYDIKANEFPKSLIEEIVEEMIMNNIRDENFLNKTLLDVIESLYNGGTMIISSLVDENRRTLSMNFILKSRDKSAYLFWIDIYRDIPYLNLSAYLYFIEWLTLNKKESFTIDFGRGLYDYKTKNFIPDIELQFTLYYAKSNFDFIKYLIKLTTLLSIKNFYKKNKSIINKVLHR